LDGQSSATRNKVILSLKGRKLYQMPSYNVKMPYPEIAVFSILFSLVMGSVGVAESPIEIRDGEDTLRKVGSTKVQIVHHQHAVKTRSELLSATFNFDKDIRVARNEFPAGKYEATLEVNSKDRVYLVFCVGKQEVFRYALRTEQRDRTDGPVIRLLVEEPDPDEEDRHEPFVELQFRWRDKLASVEIEMTGRDWRATPEPKLPDELRKPWSIAKTSLMGLVNESMDEHVEHFAEDFESDWDDGGSQEAHMQMIGRMLFEGALEDTVLKLDQLKWRKAKAKLVFQGIVLQAPDATFSLDYTVEKRSGRWKIVHLDGHRLRSS